MDPTTNPLPNDTVTPDASAPVNPGPQVIGAPQVDPSLFVQPEPAKNSVTYGIPTAPEVGTATAPNSSTEQVGAASPLNPATAAPPNFDQMANVSGFGAIGATDPITMPTPPKAPDPVEEELKAPLKAAEPVPGSIGSAISMPAQDQVGPQAPNMPMPDMSMFNQTTNRTPNVAFNDPALQQNPQMMMKPAKKKTSKTTYILLGVLGVMVIIALAAVLIIQLNS